MIVAFVDGSRTLGDCKPGDVVSSRHDDDYWLVTDEATTADDDKNTAALMHVVELPRGVVLRKPLLTPVVLMTARLEVS